MGFLSTRGDAFAAAMAAFVLHSQAQENAQKSLLNKIFPNLGIGLVRSGARGQGERKHHQHGDSDAGDSSVHAHGGASAGSRRGAHWDDIDPEKHVHDSQLADIFAQVFRRVRLRGPVCVCARAVEGDSFFHRDPSLVRIPEEGRTSFPSPSSRTM
jgi:hypothetical protein